MECYFLWVFIWAYVICRYVLGGYPLKRSSHLHLIILSWWVPTALSLVMVLLAC
jgi:hypothetical protein